MVTRIGVDIGGTFTDLVVYDDRSERVFEGKVPTRPGAPEQGVIDVIKTHVPQELVERASYFLHGTTVGLNALLERRGAKVGLICTAGLRDVLEIRRGDRAEMYNPFWKVPEPLVPRYLRIGIEERMRADGEVHRPLARESVSQAVAELRAKGVDSIAVCLMNAYANPTHELAVGAIIAEQGFEGVISLSHQVSGEYREYERTSTTVIDAFVRRRMADYLERLEAALQGLGFSGQCLITRSGGGSMTFAEATERPFETIMSGPVAGAQGAAKLAQKRDVDLLITADVGGTSFDTTLIVDGAPAVLYEGEVDGMPVQTPWVDVRSIGSGGGSIAQIDAGGLMQVGPDSAGAEPGPATYGKGGTRPTTTDAAAYLGMLGPAVLASGIRLDVDLAQKALATVATGLGKSEEEIAKGILRIAASSMANAMREITVEKGLDPRQMLLMPFGGAGPLMTTLLADELHISRVIVPPLAGNFSALGLLGADMVQSAARSAILPLDEAGLKRASDVLAELQKVTERRSDKDGPDIVATLSARLDLRFRGQEHSLSIDVESEGGRITEAAEEIAERFKKQYLRAFGSVLRQPVEIISVRASRTVALPEIGDADIVGARTDAEPVSSWNAYSFASGERMDFAVLPRGAIIDPVAGPVIVTEATSTFYVDRGWRIAPAPSGELMMTKDRTSTDD